MESSPAVRSRGITKYFADVVALDGVDLDIPRGQVHGLVGPNGAGKTTLLGLLLGLSVADKGTLEILGAPVNRVLGVPEGVAGFVDGPGLYPSLTARQNLAALAALRGYGANRAGEVDHALEHRRQLERRGHELDHAVERAVLLTQSASFAGESCRWIGAERHFEMFLLCAGRTC